MAITCTLSLRLSRAVYAHFSMLNKMDWCFGFLKISFNLIFQVFHSFVYSYVSFPLFGTSNNKKQGWEQKTILQIILTSWVESCRPLYPFQLTLLEFVSSLSNLVCNLGACSHAFFSILFHIFLCWELIISLVSVIRAVNGECWLVFEVLHNHLIDATWCHIVMHHCGLFWGYNQYCTWK